MSEPHAYATMHSLVTRALDILKGKKDYPSSTWTQEAMTAIARFPPPTQLPAPERIALALESIAEVLTDGSVDVRIDPAKR